MTAEEILRLGDNYNERFYLKEIALQLAELNAHFARRRAIEAAQKSFYTARDIEVLGEREKAHQGL